MDLERPPLVEDALLTRQAMRVRRTAESETADGRLLLRCMLPRSPAPISTVHSQQKNRTVARR